MAGLTGKKTAAEDIGQGGNFKLYTGITLLKVVSINPDQNGLKALGYKADKPPVYKDEKNGQRIAFFVEGQAEDGTKITTNVAYFLKQEPTKTFIDKYGKFSNTPDKLDKANRAAFKGELNLINFLKSWLNPEKGSEFSLKTISSKALFNGDVSELIGALKAYPENVFKGLLGVREGKYQTVYSDTLRGFVSDYSDLHANLVKAGDRISDIDFGPINLSLYKPTDFALRPYAGGAASSGGNTSGQPAEKETELVEEENPF